MTRPVANKLLSTNAKVSLVILTAAMLPGCKDQSMADLKQFVQERRQAHAGYVEPLPEFELSAGFTYQPDGIRDPFLKPEQTLARSGELPSGVNAPDFNRSREPLEKFALDALSMVGELTQSNFRWGLIRDSDGVIHRVQTGNYAGKNYGRILAINEANIAIEETVRDGTGNWITREAQLTLGE